ncbi:MAG: hypothetical protein N3F05_02270 [Candidatus Diapherotrites archaeon]|nr:hypothetical protein [Candidatus Diapherotrites archaeon]
MIEPMLFSLMASIKLGVFLIAFFHSIIVARFAKLKELELLISISFIYVLIAIIELTYIYQHFGKVASSMQEQFVLYSALFLDAIAALGIIWTLLWINKDIKKWK